MLWRLTHSGDLTKAQSGNIFALPLWSTFTLPVLTKTLQIKKLQIAS